MFNKVTIIGTGMLGGSLALALKQAQLASTIYAVDIDPATISYVLQHGIADHASHEPETGVRGADLVVLGTPVGKTLNLIKQISPYLQPGTIVTDVGSTKAKLVAAAQNLLPATVSFVGGHPMAGSEVQGIKGSNPEIFAGAAYILTPTEATNRQALAKIRQLVQGLGSRLVELEPDLHDYLVASISHLPHVLAVTLVNTVAKVQAEHPDTLNLAAGGFRDTTRIAASSPEMWRDILMSNQTNILALIDSYLQELTKLRAQIATDNFVAVKDTLSSAQVLRQKL